MSEKLYKVVRYYENENKRTRVQRRNLTLRQAQEWCNDSETSSMTAKRACNSRDKTIAKWHEDKKHWFDGYTEQ